MWNMPTHKEEPWEQDRRRVGDQRARETWEKRRRELGLPVEGWSSGPGARAVAGAGMQIRATAAVDPWTAVQRLIVIVALGGVLVTLTILLVLAVREQREEEAVAVRAPVVHGSGNRQSAGNTAVFQR